MINLVMRTETTMPIGWVPFLGAVFIVGILAMLLFFASWWIDDAVTPPENVVTPHERTIERQPPPALPE